MRILLAVDGSPCSDSAVNEIARRPWPEESEVKIISVVEPLPVTPMTETWTLPVDYMEWWAKAAQERAHVAVQKGAACLRESHGTKLRITTEVPKGFPKEVIPEEAERWDADLIVVGSHGYRGLKRLWLGSVSQAVASHAHCSVEIVRSHQVNQGGNIS